MAAARRAFNFILSCFCGGGGAEGSGHRPVRPRYPSKPRRRRVAAVASDLKAAAGAAKEEEKVSVFAVTGMSGAACAGSVEKAVKRLPGIHSAAVDVLGCRAEISFYPALVSEEKIRKTIEDVGSGAKLSHSRK